MLVRLCKGADITGATFAFNTGSNIDLSGAKLVENKGGYNFLNNITVDEYSSVQMNCTTGEDGRLACVG